MPSLKYIICLTLFWITPVLAQDRTVCLAALPGLADDVNHGLLVGFVRTLDAETKTRSQIIVQPFSRCLHSVAEGDADIMLPMIETAGIETKNLKLSRERIFRVTFSLYTKSKITLSPEVLASLKIETDLAHVGSFDFPVIGSASLENSFRKLDAGRIDGVLFARYESDLTISRLGLSGLVGQDYATYPVHAVLGQSPNSVRAEKWLSSGIDAIRAHGDINKVFAALEPSRLARLALTSGPKYVPENMDTPTTRTGL